MYYLKKILLLIVIPFVTNGFAAQAEWKNLNDVDPSEKREILTKNVYSNPEFFPPLYQAAYDLQQLFSLAGIRSITNFGALLGMFRDGINGLMPWDDDFDFAVTKDQESKLKKIVPLADKLGYDLFPDDTIRDGIMGNASVGYKMYRREQLTNPENGEKHWVFLDIFLYQPDEHDDRKYVLSREKARTLMPKSWLKKEELDNIVHKACGPIQKMPCSAYSKNILYRMYDEDCELTARFYNTHHREVPVCYIWTIHSEDQYPDHNGIMLKSNVAKLLESMSILELKSYVCEEKQPLLETKSISEIVSSLLA